ncbi:MAG: hypothetical protein LBU22_10985 [Dysgonamonadaceae bacterium]|nr:hypothetical protein [Dysgonamonadaceae bacterium]
MSLNNNTTNGRRKNKSQNSHRIASTQQTENHTIPTAINFQWKEIIRIMNMQKAVATIAQNNYEEVIIGRRCSDLNEKVQTVYSKLNYKSQAFTKRKFVVLKSEFQKMEFLDYNHFPT